MKTLIVEDDATTRQAIEQQLQALGHEVTTCADAETALEACHQTFYSLIILDLDLPGMDSFDLCRRIRALPQEDRSMILVITAYDRPGDIQAALDAGMDDYLIKPIGGEQLHVRVTIIERQLHNLSERKRVQKSKRQIEEILERIGNGSLTLEELEQYHYYFQEMVKRRSANLQKDLAERKQVEEALRESEERFQTLLRSLDDVVWAATADEAKTPLYFNPAIERVYGRPIAEFLDNPDLWFEVVHPDDKEEVIQHARKLQHGIEYRIIRPDGEVRWLYDRKSVVYNETGTPIRGGIVTDITERKRAENALIRERNLLRTLMDNSPDHIYFKDTESRFISIIKALADWFGLSDPEQAVGKTDVDFFTEEHARPAYADEREVMRTGQPLVGKEEKETWPDGQETWVSTTKVPLRDKEGHIIGTFGISRDITRHKQAEEEMARLRSFMQNIIDSMPSILVGIDPTGRVTHWNFQARKITGVSSEQARGRMLTDVLPQLMLNMEKVHRAIQQREPQKEEKVVSRIDGETRYSDMIIYPLVSNGVEGVVIRIDDVTSRVRFEEMMIQSEKMISVGGLAAGMAHELNNPLASMLQNAQVVLNRLTETFPANKRAAAECGTSMEAITRFAEKRDIVGMLEFVKTSGERAAQIVGDMLSFSRKSEFHIAPLYDIRTLLDKTIELAANVYDLKKKYDFRRIEIVREYDSDVPKVPCDQSKIQQVILNLLMNAAQAMAEQKNRNKMPRIILRAAQDDRLVRLEVKDNGPGMPEHVRKRVFEPFFTTKEVGVGTGLGLSVSYFIITKNHRGAMSVESEPGKGTTFIIRLPLERHV